MNDQTGSGSAGATPVELYGPADGGWYTTRVHDWIALCPDLKDVDVRGYMILRSLVIEKYKNPIRKLTLAALGELIPGVNGKTNSLGRVRGVLSNLSAVGLVATPEGGPVRTSSRLDASLKPIRIRINDMPPEGYAGWRNTEAKLAFVTKHAATPAASDGAGQNFDPHAAEEDAGQNSDPAGRNSDPTGQNSDPDEDPDVQERDLPLVPSVGTGSGGDALSARSAGDARRASDGSSAHEAESGCAASSKDDPAPRKPKHTKQQLDLVRAVRAHFPADLLNGWTDPATGRTTKPLPDVWELSQAILEALAGDVPGADRTVAQLGARIQQRWNHHGWASKFYALEMSTPVGAAVDMVRPLKSTDRYGCANPRCDAGRNVDTGDECATCPERMAARKADRRTQRAREAAAAVQRDVPAQRETDFLPPRECPCGNPIGKTAEDPLCTRCRQNADEAEKTALLRAQIAAQFGTPDQVEAYTRTEAPF